MFDAELEAFKSEIDLRSYAAGQGYQLDGKSSWRGSAVMRHPSSDDKIIIKRDEDGHYVFFSVRQGNDNGSIIDFVKNRQRISLGTVRKELRPYLHSMPAALPRFIALPVTKGDRLKVERNFALMQAAPRHPYLENKRKIPAEMLSSERFAGRVSIDRMSNAVFPHFDEDGLCGYEMKNTNFMGFSSGGLKGLWMSNTSPDDRQIVFCESAIDALSYAAIFPALDTRYASIGGRPNPIQPKLISEAVMALQDRSVVIAAMDADADGNNLAEIVRQAVADSGRSDLEFKKQEPFGFKDWNDQLRATPALPDPRTMATSTAPAVA